MDTDFDSYRRSVLELMGLVTSFDTELSAYRLLIRQIALQCEIGATEIADRLRAFEISPPLQEQITAKYQARMARIRQASDQSQLEKVLRELIQAVLPQT